jgi:hypothetical protein
MNKKEIYVVIFVKIEESTINSPLHILIDFEVSFEN